MSRVIENRWLSGLKRCWRTLGWFSKPRAQTVGLGMQAFGDTLFHGGWRFGKRISCAYPCRETEFPQRRAFPNPQFGNEAKRLLAILLLLIAVPVVARPGNPDRAVASFAREDYDTVRTAEYFTVGGVGYAGTPSNQEIAFRRLLLRPEPVSHCRKLVTEATPAGQLYGLLGLRLLERQAFQTALPSYKNSRTDIQTMRGCIVIHTTVGRLARQIQKGALK